MDYSVFAKVKKDCRGILIEESAEYGYCIFYILQSHLVEYFVFTHVFYTKLKFSCIHMLNALKRVLCRFGWWNIRILDVTFFSRIDVFF